MVIRASDFKQSATYWGSPVSNGFGGYTYTRSTIDCRWEERVEQFTDHAGEMKVSRAVVFVQQDLDLDGWLFLGSSSEADPSNQVGAFPIQQFRKIPDLRNVLSERRAYL